MAVVSIIMVNQMETRRPLPRLPDSVPWLARQICYGARRLPRGYARVLVAMAGVFPSLRSVKLDTFFSGTVCADLGELICQPLFVRGYYAHQYGEDVLLDRLISQGMKVFDLGANIGYYTAFFSHRVGPGGLVVAVEPAPRALRILKSTIDYCDENIRLLECAMGAEDGDAAMREMHRLDISYVQFGTHKDGKTVAVRTLDGIVDEFGAPDLVKIDIEGAELLALQGSRRLLSSERPPVVMLEYIEGNARNFGSYNRETLLSFFPADKWVRFRIARDGALVGLDCSEIQGGTNDYLAIPSDRVSEVQDRIRVPRL